MAATVEVDERAQLNEGSGIIAGRSEFFNSGIVRGDVGLVVFVVVEFHDFSRYGGFESAIVILKIEMREA